MWDNPDDQRVMARALLGRVCLIAAILLVFLGFFLPTHDYAGLGDPVLESIVSDDARDVTAMLATTSVFLAVAAMVVIRSRGFVVAAAVVLFLGLINLVRLAPYYGRRSLLTATHGHAAIRAVIADERAPREAWSARWSWPPRVLFHFDSFRKWNRHLAAAFVNAGPE